MYANRRPNFDMGGIATILATLGDSPRDLRNAALLSMASDTLCRESELVAIEVAHLHLNCRRNTWSLHVPYSKTNQDGESPDHRFVSHEAIARVSAWQAAAGITEGPLFRPVGGRPKLTGDAFPALLPQEVARIFRRRAHAAGLEGAAGISGHSARIGSANDLAESGASITQICGRTHIGVLQRNEHFKKLNEPKLTHSHTGYSHEL